MTNHTNGPALWRELLELIPDTAFVVGGAIRDYLLDKEAKDIDIFTPACSETYVKEVERALILAGAVRKRDSGDTSYSIFWRKHSDHTVKRTMTFDLWGFDVQVVFVDLGGGSWLSPKALLDRVDFGICRVSYGMVDGHYRADFPKEFEKDVRDRTITLYRADTAGQHAYSLKRFQRLTAEKFAGWTFEDESIYGRLLDVDTGRLLGDAPPRS